MKPEQLVRVLERDVIEGNIELYRNLLNTTNEAQDPVWKGILPMYIEFSKEEKDVFLKFLRIVEINTLSHVLGILDGSTYVDEIDDDLLLTTENSNVKINEDLQDLFLELIEGK
ncbi:hypothetical protein SAMN05421594_4734 [Chryseobacterium oleae]|uniref:Uncharacterized protein n=1 Tax=Chryseobacterium oleae TaxID=491207 RepID=A0A1I5CZY5_CHROL|nr:hypothetical protein [Chryseobacterium oleae]SFN92416.1 hypothetical protein SAMN05421594_4734 [Chryseobacterium oleae]